MQLRAQAGEIRNFGIMSGQKNGYDIDLLAQRARVVLKHIFLRGAQFRALDAINSCIISRVLSVELLSMRINSQDSSPGIDNCLKLANAPPKLAAPL